MADTNMNSTASSNNEGNTNGSIKKGSVAATHTNTNNTHTNSSSSSSTPNRPVLTKRSSALNNSSTAASAAMSTRSPRIRTSSTKATTTGTATTSGAVFNPLLIFYQIMALQFFHYLILATFLQINRALFGTTVTLDRIFTANYLNLWNASGWVDNVTILLSFLMGYVGGLIALCCKKLSQIDS